MLEGFKTFLSQLGTIGTVLYMIFNLFVALVTLAFCGVIWWILAALGLFSI